MKYSIKIENLRPNGAVKAYASVNLNNEFAINDAINKPLSKNMFAILLLNS